MDREALLNALLDFFLGEEDAPGLPGPLPEEYGERRRLLRALMNVRPPRPVPDDVLVLQLSLIHISEPTRRS